MEKQTRGWVGIQAAGIVQEMVIKYPEKVFFTADTHFSSDRVLPFRRRYSSKEEMNATLVKLWNETVPPDGIVFHLGDFAYGSMLQIQALANSLNGTIYLITGNHDSEPAFICQAGDEMPKIIPLGHYFSVRILGRKFELSHYPFLCYEGEHAGVIQLFGHVHSGGEDEGFDIPRLQYLLPFQYDVGIDNNNDRPVSLMKILEMFPFEPGPTIDVSAKMYPYLINEVQAIAGDYGLDFPAEVLLNDIDLGYARTLRIRGEVVGYFAIVPAGSEDGIGWLENGGLCCCVRRFVCALGGSGCVKKIINAAHTNYDDIRILTPTNDVDIELRRLGFQYRGEVEKGGVVLKGYQRIYK
jgi:calcineurin-like phosphoesterase family protein